MIYFFRNISYINISFHFESLRFHPQVHREFNPLIFRIYLQGIIPSCNIFLKNLCAQLMGLLKTENSCSCSLTPRLPCRPGNVPEKRLKGEFRDTHISIQFSPSILSQTLSWAPSHPSYFQPPQPLNSIQLSLSTCSLGLTFGNAFP